jgi:hypothetical protein
MVSKIKIENIDSNIIVKDEKIKISPVERNVIAVIGNSGPQGIPGPAGVPGEVLFSDLSYVHIQEIASNTWTINHGLRFIPGITVIDSAGSVVEGDYEYPDENTIIARFNGSFAGKAYLS